MVYVDNMKVPYRGMIMCHMVADTNEELFAMAKRIGVNLKWVQNPNTPKEHFDICQAKRKLAVSYGAKEITMKELAMITIKKRDLKQIG